jgi:adenylate cyclase
MSIQQKVTRKLRAILSADVKGYSLLMSDDEVFTIQTLKSYRKFIASLITQHSGRVVDSPGDNLLAEFSSAVDAVECAVEVQKKMKKENLRFVEDRRLEFRIGVNIGDVVQDGDRIYGSGVNIAARIEKLADPGGICVSRSAYDQVKDKLDFTFEYVGEHEAKNIKEPVRVYRVLLDSDSLKPLLEEQLELPDKPSIAVLPFDNLSGHPEDEFIADGISETIITALSKTPRIFVIARNSTFTYKGKATKVQKIAEDLGIQYVLEGSIQKSKDQLRINAQLIDAINGKHLWAEKYDRNMKDLFALQDDITMKIITALNVKLTQGEVAAVYAKGTDNLEAYLKAIQGLQHLQRFSRESITISQKMAKEAISLDPNYPVAYYLLSLAQQREIVLGIAKSPKTSLKLSIENARKAISLDDTFAEAQALLGWLYTMIRQHEKGIAAAKRALTLRPNSAEAYYYLGLTLNYAGKHEEAIRIYQKGLRLSPVPSVNALFCLCIACRDYGRYEEGISAAKKALHLEPDSIPARTCLASCYALLGRESEAKAESAEIMKIDPNFSLKGVERLPYKELADNELIIDSLRKAGLPE